MHKKKSPLEIFIRKACAEDIKKIVPLGRLLLKYDYQFDNSIDLNCYDSVSGLSFIEERITSSNGIVLIAFDGDKAVGYLVGGITQAASYRKIKISAELEEIFVLEEYRGNNLGSNLIAKFCTFCDENGAEKISVRVSAENKSALNLYRRFNFKDYDLILER